MPFCPNCGAAVEGRFCANCGAAVTPGETGDVPPGAGPAGSQYAAPPVATSGISENVAGVLCYIVGLITGILFLVLSPYNQNKFVRFHAFQSIFFHLAWIAVWILEAIVASILLSISLTLSSITWLISLVISLAALGSWIFVMVKAYHHERYKLPIIGDLAEKQA